MSRKRHANFVPVVVGLLRWGRLLGQMLSEVSVAPGWLAGLPAVDDPRTQVWKPHLSGLTGAQTERVH